MDAIVLLREDRKTVGKLFAGPRGPAVAVAAAVALAGLLCGCGASPARLEGARQAGQAFEESLTAADYSRACALPAPQTRRQLEQDEGKPCGPALRGQELPSAGEVRGTQVYGRQAMLRLQGDTLFLSQFDDGWKVVAADCTPQRQDDPYRCSLKGG
ncbi:hypothetical protein [Streptomyces sp. XY332]|uniref:hypothetical protein n=1 Tax=Streptomyces sp. XY332 TaxID=1415561 RepID=UPI001F2A1C90|nr:hypothetical protein [Streptomyces sp. XY332]